MNFEFIESIADVDPAEWNTLVGAASPFLEHGFLRALETSGCVGEGTGWHPQILVARAGDDTADDTDSPKSRLIGALPIYLKTHSMGEFVFDWSWADAAMRAGLRYYPKAVVAVPLTPIQGRRILVDETLDPARTHEVKRALIDEAIAFASRAQLSSLHFNFVHPDEIAILEELGLPIRVGMQFHWHNQPAEEESGNYADFDEFLGRFRSKKRANIRRERRKLAEAGVTTEVRTADEISAGDLDRIFDYYLDTIEKLAWGRQYLNREFFAHLGELLPERLHLVFASQNGEEFGGAFNLWKNEGLYGRYWGCTREVDFAHFETCLYRPIEWCIEHGVQVFQPGAQGPHKYDRGFDPTPTYSAHWIGHPGLRNAVEAFIEQERREMEAQIRQMRRESPIRH